MAHYFTLCDNQTPVISHTKSQNPLSRNNCSIFSTKQQSLPNIYHKSNSNNIRLIIIIKFNHLKCNTLHYVGRKGMTSFVQKRRFKKIIFTQISPNLVENFPKRKINSTLKEVIFIFSFYHEKKHNY